MSWREFSSAANLARRQRANLPTRQPPAAHEHGLAYKKDARSRVLANARALASSQNARSHARAGERRRRRQEGGFGGKRERVLKRPPTITDGGGDWRLLCAR